MKQKRRWLSFMLVICLLSGMIPAEGKAADGEALLSTEGQTCKAIQPGAGNISQDSGIYYGTYEQDNNLNNGEEPILWSVLSATPEGDGLLLMSEKVLDARAFREGINSNAGKSPENARYWKDSSLRSWLNGPDDFLSHFSADEQSSIRTTELETAENNGYESGGNAIDKVFVLSMEEAASIISDSDRKGVATAYALSKGLTDWGSGCVSWWLRSPGNDIYSAMAAYVNYNGSVVENGFNVDNDGVGVRPAFNLNLDSVLFASAAQGGKFSAAEDAELSEISTYGGDEWKLTLYDADRSGFQVQTEAVTESKAVISYSDAQTEGNEYISAIIQDDTTKKYTYYGRLKKLSSLTDKSDTVEIELPSDMTGKTLYVFNEQYNGDYMTDYASDLKKVATVQTAYTVEYKGMENLTTNGKSYHKIGDTAYSAKLSVSDENYILPQTIAVKVGDRELTAEELAGVYNASTGEITLKNVSGDVVITANGMAKSYDISVEEADSSGNVTLDEKHIGYKESPKQTVSLTNTGNQNVSDIRAALNGADGFTLDTAGMKTSLAPGEETSFTVSSRTELEPGTYTGEVAITGNNNVKKEISLTFTVTGHSYAFHEEVPAGHEQDGTAAHYTCGYCNLLFDGNKNVVSADKLVIAQTGHSYRTDWSHDRSKHWKECDCGAKTEEAVHTFTWVTDKEATATEAGERHEECSICGYAKESVATPEPSATPTATVTLEPSATPTATPTLEPSATPTVTPASEEPDVVTAEEKQSAREGLNQAVQAGKSYNRIHWMKVTGADGYIIYGSRCNHGGTERKLKKLKTITSGKTTRYTHKGLKKNTWYKYKVTAYKLANGKKVKIGSSLCLHSLTKGSRYANPSKVKVSRTKITLKKGKSVTVKAEAVLPKGKKKKKHTAEIRYVVSNPDIVSVSKKGKIKGKKKGSCTVYAVAQNGVYKKIKIKVK